MELKGGYFYLKCTRHKNISWETVKVLGKKDKIIEKQLSRKIFKNITMNVYSPRFCSNAKLYDWSNEQSTTC